MMQWEYLKMEPSNRIETGTVQFDEDWRGLFIRGDNAMQFAMALEMLMDNPEAARDNPFSVVAPLQGLLQLLRSSNHHFEDVDCQMLKKFEECKK